MSLKNALSERTKTNRNETSAMSEMRGTNVACLRLHKQDGQQWVFPWTSFVSANYEKGNFSHELGIESGISGPNEESPEQVRVEYRVERIELIFFHYEVRVTGWNLDCVMTAIAQLALSELREVREPYVGVSETSGEMNVMQIEVRSRENK